MKVPRDRAESVTGFPKPCRDAGRRRTRKTTRKRENDRRPLGASEDRGGPRGQTPVRLESDHGGERREETRARLDERLVGVEAVAARDREAADLQDDRDVEVSDEAHVDGAAAERKVVVRL